MILSLMLAASPVLGAPRPQEAPQPDSPRLEAVVDPRVELVSLVCRLADFPEYAHASSKSAYSQSLDRDFAQFREHAAVKRMRALRLLQGISYDAPMSLAVHLTDAPELGELVPFDLPPVALEERWKTKDARAFAADLRDFAEVSGFMEFAAEQQEFYRACAARLEEAATKQPFLDWFDRFFGKKEGAHFRVVAGLLNSQNNYGVRVVVQDGSERLSPILGVPEWDADGLPVFGAGFDQLLAHEFCHSYTNPVVRRHLDSLSGVGEKLMARDPGLMRRQAYGDVKSMLNETFVRACVGRYVLESGGEEALEQYIEHNHGRGFVWTEGLVGELAAYEADRERYPDIESFLPNMQSWLEAFAEVLKSSGDVPK